VEVEQPGEIDMAMMGLSSRHQPARNLDRLWCSYSGTQPETADTDKATPKDLSWPPLLGGSRWQRVLAGKSDTKKGEADV
jgi:hypothetical protein